MKTNKIIFSLLILLMLFSQFSLINAEAKYTREHSEELFHLIDWYEYSPETFEFALKEQKPIYLIISAPAWCYWCHVYESEDYLYHEDLYPYINENFIPIFVDSDKRPDLTKKYLEGGWPSTTIFSPDFRRIIGFTGPRDHQGLRTYLGELTIYLEEKNFTDFAIKVNYQETQEKIPSIIELNQLENNFLAYVESVSDPLYGGFGPSLSEGEEWREGQKFPRWMTLKYLLEKYEETGNEDYLDIVKITFENQYTDINEIEDKYRLYDPVEGGFHRYSTKRDWSIPHYEKMLFDQAKLLQTYTQLLTITNDKDVETAVKGTISFLTDKFYDSKGGFYSSQDAYLEEEYFGLTENERDKIEPPYIDKTRNIDSNSMVVVSLLDLYNTYENEEYKEMAKNTLDFLEDNMISKEGAYYYFDYDKEKAFLTGQSISNSWAMLAFIGGYESLGDETYLETSEDLASYSLDNLYDWNSGGFFERNSKDTEFYAPNERVDFSKPYSENAVFSYGMLKLYLITGNLEYLESGLKTTGYLIDRASGLDETYYLLKTSELIKENYLINVYQENELQIANLVETKQENFFLNDLLKESGNGISIDDAPKLKDEFASVGFIILAILAFSAGILSFLSPCTLPVLSAYFATTINTKKGEVIRNTVFFFLGLAIIFSIFGMGATLVGSLFRENRILFTQIAGLLIIIFGTLEIFGKGFSGLQIRFKGKKNPMGSFIFGMIFAIGWSACIGPILASLLLLSATTGTIVKGTSLLFIYAIGLFIPLIFVSLYFDRIKNKKFWDIIKGKMINIHLGKKEIRIHSTSLISGIILIVLGILIFNDYLFKLNQIALQTDFVQNIIINGEEFLKRVFVR